MKRLFYIASKTLGSRYNMENKVFCLLAYSNCMNCENKKSYLEPDTQILL